MAWPELNWNTVPCKIDKKKKSIFVFMYDPLAKSSSLSPIRSNFCIVQGQTEEEKVEGKVLIPCLHFSHTIINIALFQTSKCKTFVYEHEKFYF